MANGLLAVHVLLVHPDPGVAAAIRTGTAGSPCEIEVVHHADAVIPADLCEASEFDLVIVGGGDFEPAIAAIRRRDPIVPLVLLICERDVERIAWRHGIDMFVRDPVLLPARWQSIVIDAILRRSCPRQGTEVSREEWDDAMVRVQAVRNRRHRLAELNRAGDALTRAVSERDDATRRLEEAAINYRAIFDAPTEGKVVLDPVSLRVVDFNPAASELFGCDTGHCDRSQVCIGRCFGDPDDPANNLVAIIRKTVVSGRETAERVMRKASGEAFLAEISMARVSLSGETRIVMQVRDIEHRRRNQAVATTALSKLHAIFDLCPTPVIEADISGFMVSLNPAAERLFNITTQDAHAFKIQGILGDPAAEALRFAALGSCTRTKITTDIFGEERQWLVACDPQWVVFVAGN